MGAVLRRSAALVGFVLAAVCIVLPALADAAISMTGKSGRFTPSTVTIKVGETVTWRYVGEDYTEKYVYHSVRSRPGQAEQFNSDSSGKCARSHYDDCFGPEEGKNIQEFAHRFTHVGKFDFVCEFHGDEGMTGSVVVEAAAAAPLTSAPTAPTQTDAADATPSAPSETTAVSPEATPLALEEGSDSNTGLIAGAVIGGLVVLGGAIALGYTIARRRAA